MEATTNSIAMPVPVTKAQVSAGCGVVEGSQPLREWAELALKRDAIYRNLGVER